MEGSDVTKLGENPVPGGHELDNVGFVFFNDPDRRRLPSPVHLGSMLGTGGGQIAGHAHRTIGWLSRHQILSHFPGLTWQVTAHVTCHARSGN